jgi:hypothetical protein
MPKISAILGSNFHSLSHDLSGQPKENTKPSVGVGEGASILSNMLTGLYLLFIFSFLAVLEFELRALHLVGRCSTTPTVLFALVIFLKQDLTLHWGLPGLQSSYLCFPHSRDDRHTPPCPDIGLANFLPRLTLNHDPMILQISTSQVARITGLSHHTWISFVIFLINAP